MVLGLVGGRKECALASRTPRWDFCLCLFHFCGWLYVKETIHNITVAHCATYQKGGGSVFVGFVDYFLYCEFVAISPDSVVDFQF